MLICTGCGELVQEAQLRRVRESHGETFLSCPACGDTCIEAVQCECGEWQPNKDGLGLGHVLDCIGVKYD